MKKILMGLAFIIAVAGALFTNNKSYAVASKAPNVTLYKPEVGCPTRECTTINATYVCTDLKISCSGAAYTGDLKRNEF